MSLTVKSSCGSTQFSDKLIKSCNCLAARRHWYLIRVTSHTTQISISFWRLFYIYGSLRFFSTNLWGMVNNSLTLLKRPMSGYQLRKDEGRSANQYTANLHYYLFLLGNFFGFLHTSRYCMRDWHSLKIFGLLLYYTYFQKNIQMKTTNI